jgi:hypothetical protein
MVKALAVTVELTGTQLSKAAARVMAEDLAQYPEGQVLVALSRCRRELKGRLTISDVLDRLPGWHPGPEEAWAICGRCLNDERATAVWTDEMAQAFGVACRLRDDPVASRMAFKEAYSSNVAQARISGRMPRWTVSPGEDKDGRELAILDAVEKGRITVQYAQVVLPHHRDDAGLNARLIALTSTVLKRIEDKAA